MAHRLGTAFQDMGPLDGCGAVITSVALECGSCGWRWLMERYTVVDGFLSHLKPHDRKVFCPYCGTEDNMEMTRNFATDTRPMMGDD